MADLSAVVTAIRYGRSPLGVPVEVLVTSIVSERPKLSESAQGLVYEFATLTASLSETGLHLYADTVSRIWNESGDIAFVASPDHALVLWYEAHLRVSGNSTIVATAYLGKQTPDGNNVIIHALRPWFEGRTPGTYTVSVAACDADEVADSAESNPFTIPLPGAAERVAVRDTVTAVRV
jgi:hypothetical protein